MSALIGSVIDVPLRPLNQQAPTTTAPVGRLKAMINKIATRYEAGNGDTLLRVEPRGGFQHLTPVVRDVTSGALISSNAGVPGANLLSSLNDQVVAVSSSAPYVLAENENAWSKYPYVYTPTVVRERPVYTQNSQIANPDAANIGGVYFRTWSEPNQPISISPFVRAMVVDADGTVIRAPWKMVTGDSNARAKVVSDGTRFWVVFSIFTTVHVQVFDTHGVLIAETDFDTLDHKAAGWDLTYCGGYVLFTRYNTSTLGQLTRLTISGVTITASTFNLGFVPLADHGIAWAENASADGNAYLLTSHIDGDGSTTEYAYRIGNLATTPSVTAFMGEAGTGKLFNEDGEGDYVGILSEMTGVYRGGVLYTQLSFFHQTDVRQSRTVFLQSAAATSATVFPTVRSVMAASRPFVHDGRDVVLAYFPSADTVIVTDPVSGQPRAYGGEPTYFLLDILTQQCCGRFNAGNAGMEWPRTDYPASGIFYRNGAYLFCLPHVFVQNGITHVPTGVQSASFNQTVKTGSDIIQTYIRVVSAVGYQDLEFGGVGQAIESGGELLMPGAIATSFDGLKFSENNLNLAPSTPTLTPGTGGNLTPLGRYEYIVVFQAINRQGDRILSATSFPVVINLSGVNNKVTLTGFPLHMTTRTDVTIAIYRNSIGPGGTPTSTHYRVDNPLQPLLNDPTALTWTFVDTTTDQAILSNETLYTDNRFLQRDPMPSFSVGTVFGGRVCCVGPDNAIWYSAEKVEGDALWFSLSQRIPAFTQETIKNLVAMDGRLVAICEKSVWLQEGSGMPGPTGEGGNIQPAIKQTFTNGGTGHAHLIEAGVAYSSSEGGVWLITRGGENRQISGPVQGDMAGQTISGIVVDDAQRMHVALGAGGSVVLDQLNDAWAHNVTPTAPLKLHKVRGKAALADAFGVAVQSPTAYTDSDGAGSQLYIIGTVEFEPLHFGGVKKYTRLWAFNIQGDTLGNHTLTMTATYDPDTNPIAESWTWPVSQGDKFSFEFQPKFEQMENMTLKFVESFPAGPAYDGRTFALEILGFYVALESGLARVPLARRIQST